MDSGSNWRDGITRRIDQLKDTLGEKDYKKYKLDLLRCVAERIAEFSPECGQCRIFQQDISTLTQDVGNTIQTADKVRRKAHARTIDRIVDHLQKQHKLVTEGYYLGMWMGIGLALGLPTGIPLGNISLGLPIGLCIGVAIGTSLDAKAKKEGRVICPGEKAISSLQGTKLMILIGLAVLLLAGLVAFMLLR